MPSFLNLSILLAAFRLAHIEHIYNPPWLSLPDIYFQVKCFYVYLFIYYSKTRFIYYSKTRFRVKHKCEVSSPIKENVGVNQVGNCSHMLFRKYLADLSDYMYTHTGICVNEEIMIHRLWTDGLFTVASSVSNGWSFVLLQIKSNNSK